MDATQILGAFRELGEVKELSKQDLHELLKDGIMAALARRYGMNVEAEITIDEQKGSIDIVVLKEVVETVEDPSREISLEEARWDDADFQAGDVLEIPVEFSQFGRNAVMAAKQRIIQRVREGERDKIRAEYEHRVGELLSAEVQQVERGKLVLMVNRSRDADAIIPWKEQNPREPRRGGAAGGAGRHPRALHARGVLARRGEAARARARFRALRGGAGSPQGRRPARGEDQAAGGYAARPGGGWGRGAAAPSGRRRSDGGARGHHPCAPGVSLGLDGPSIPRLRPEAT